VYVGNGFEKSPDVNAIVDASNAELNTCIENLRNLSVAQYNDKCCDWLDWFALGVYGFQRPIIAIDDTVRADGGWGSFGWGTHGWGYGILGNNPSFESVPDDIFIKTLQWHLYRGDGFQFCISWLRRRIQRFTGEYVVSIELELWSFAITLPKNRTTNYFKYLILANKLELPEQFTYAVYLT
jgi:hypothetical protein